MIPPRATYRLQLRKSFGFADAARIAPYLARLGISHAYVSPVFKARPGSTHGYDITDHSELNPELGTEADYEAMIAAFRREGLSVILDTVPNHMGVGGADNPLWLDVLKWGQESHYAGWFDIDWSAHVARAAASCSRRCSASNMARRCTQESSRCGSTRRPEPSPSGLTTPTSCRSVR